MIVKFSLLSLVSGLLALNCVAQINPPVTAMATLEAGTKDRDLQTILYFEGISFEKLLINSPALVGKNYRIIINEFVKGTLTKTDIVFDSSEDAYFKLKADKLGFAVVSKVTEDNEFKISFQFNGFSAGRNYPVDARQKNKFTLKSFFYKEASISLAPEVKNYLLALMTPYVRADKSEAYCEVAQSGMFTDSTKSVISMLFEYLVIEITEDSKRNGLGTHQFKAPLHKGDFITMDNKGEEEKYFGGKAYEVIAVKLAIGAPTVGDLIVKLIGGDEDLNDQLRSERTKPLLWPR